MIQFIIRRLIASIPVLLGVVVIVFVIVRVIPGDPCTALLGEKANAERIKDLIELARVRGVSLDSLLESLNISPPPVE